MFAFDFVIPTSRTAATEESAAVGGIEAACYLCAAWARSGDLISEKV